jgi:hypothetical protein
MLIAQLFMETVPLYLKPNSSNQFRVIYWPKSIVARA